jgi:hypothetical protein
LLGSGPHWAGEGKGQRCGRLDLFGGGYWNLYWQQEGEEVAARLNPLGMTGTTLKYRAPRRPDEPKGELARRLLQDAQRAVSRVREWALDAKQRAAFANDRCLAASGRVLQCPAA